MGAIGEDYPNGTVYLCHFSGRFLNIEKVDEYSYSMTLSELNCDDEGGEEWIEDGICYVPAAPYGMEDGETFVLYLPDTPTDGLDEDFLKLVAGVLCAGRSAGNTGKVWPFECQNGIWVLL